MAASVVESSHEQPDHAVLGVLGVIGAARAGLDARLIEAARIVVATTGAALLADKGFATVEELTDAQRRAWRSEAKRAACAEIEATLGLGVVEARHLVGVACAPRGVRTPVLGALDRGDVTWGMVRDFWRRCARLSSDDASLVAESLFGTEAATAAPERLTPDDLLRDSPWHAADYRAALEREATRAEGVDVQAERDRRREAYRQRRASVVVDADGTATLSVTGPLISIVAAHSRIERAARLLRKHGDLRTLDQLRADITAALLVHGQLPLPDEDDSSGWRDLQVPDLDRIARVITGMPTVQLQVVLPWDTLTGNPACTHVGEDERSGRDVAHLLGAHPAALTPGHARELALMPDTTLSRLLSDPADGRLVERTLTTYRPDADMRRQVLAADVHSRAPGTRHPGTTCDLDHVSPWGGSDEEGQSLGGPTAETNLVALGRRPHQLKTLGWATARINDLRDLTWTTLLGHTTTTRTHDYRHYAPTTRPSASGPDRTADPPPPPGPDEQRDVLNRALYDALGARGPDALLTDDDDHPGAGDHGGPLSRWMFIPRRPAGGQPPSAPRRAHTAGSGPAGAQPGAPSGVQSDDASAPSGVQPDDPGAPSGVQPDDPGTARDPDTRDIPPGRPWSSPPDTPPPF